MQCGVVGGIRDEADVPVRTDGDEPPLADPEGRRQYRVALANLPISPNSAASAARSSAFAPKANTR